MKYTFKQFQAEYPDDQACLDKVLEMRYGGKEFDCPGCGGAANLTLDFLGRHTVTR